MIALTAKEGMNFTLYVCNKKYVSATLLLYPFTSSCKMMLLLRLSSYSAKDNDAGKVICSSQHLTIIKICLVTMLFIKILLLCSQQVKLRACTSKLCFCTSSNHIKDNDNRELKKSPCQTVWHAPTSVASL